MRFLHRFSVITHPIFLPFYLMFVLWTTGIEMFSLERLVLITLLLLVIPIMTLFGLKKMGLFTDIIHMDLQERRKALLITMVYFAFIYLGLGFGLIKTLVSAVIINHFFLYLLTRKRKVSLHLNAWSSFFTALWAIDFYVAHISMVLIIGALLFMILVGWVRWKLKAHTKKELLIGGLTGIVTVILVFLTQYGI